MFHKQDVTQVSGVDLIRDSTQLLIIPVVYEAEIIHPTASNTRFPQSNYQSITAQAHQPLPMISLFGPSKHGDDGLIMKRNGRVSVDPQDYGDASHGS